MSFVNYVIYIALCFDWLKNSFYVFSDVAVDPVLTPALDSDLRTDERPFIEEFINPSNYKWISSSPGSEFNTI